jgi:heterodisulfide reductase subunit B
MNWSQFLTAADSAIVLKHRTCVTHIHTYTMFAFIYNIFIIDNKHSCNPYYFFWCLVSCGKCQGMLDRVLFFWNKTLIECTNNSLKGIIEGLKW